jgi:hypothetical protein
MNPTFAQSLNRIRKIWLLVLAQGVAYIYLGSIYLEARLVDYFWLGKIFIAANMTMGMVEILFYSYFNKKAALIAFPGSLFDIVVGVLILFLPVISIVLLPLFVGMSQVLRGVIYLVLFNTGSRYNVTGLTWLKYLGWARIFWAVVIIAAFLLAIRTPKVLAAMALMIDGLIVIAYAIRLRLLKRDKKLQDLPPGYNLVV